MFVLRFWIRLSYKYLGFKFDVPKMDQLPIIHVKRVDKYYHITSPFNNAIHFMVIIFVSLKVAQSNFDF